MPSQRFDLGADLERGVFGLDAVAFVDEPLHGVEVFADLLRGLAGQQLRVGAAAAGDEGERRGEAGGEREQGCGNAGHGASLDNGLGSEYLPAIERHCPM